MAVLPARICMNMISVHSPCMVIGRVSRDSRSISWMALPVLAPGATLPVTGAAV